MKDVTLVIYCAKHGTRLFFYTGNNGDTLTEIFSRNQHIAFFWPAI